MKKILHELIVVFFIVFAIYLISDSEFLPEKKVQTNRGRSSQPSVELEGAKKGQSELSQDRYNKLCRAREELRLYRFLCKKKFVERIAVRHGDEIIDLNTGNGFELRKLKGIGASFSKRILDDRVENGIFHKVEELKRVKGIGEKKLQAILKGGD